MYMILGKKNKKNQIYKIITTIDLGAVKFNNFLSYIFQSKNVIGQTLGPPWVDPPMAQPTHLNLLMGPAHSFYAI